LIKRTLHRLLGMIDHAGMGGKDTDLQLEIRGVTTDSRDVRPGNLFIPLIGERFDGHEYAAESAAKGAAAALWQIDHPAPPEHIPVIFVEDTLKALQQLASAYRRELSARVVGITGSNGKTTTKDVAAALLSTVYKVHKTTGNLNNHIGLPLTLLQMDEDTEIAVVEMGMSGRGEIQRLSGLARPEAVIITNIGEAHLLQLRSREEIAKAKLEIVSGLADDGLLIYPGDEPLIENLLRDRERFRREMGFPLPVRLKTFRFGTGEHNDLYPTGVMLAREGTQFMLNWPDFPPLYIPLLGRHNVTNVLACIALCRYMGVPAPKIADRLKHVQVTGMRIEKIRLPSGVTVINDAYNASPSSVKAALALLEDLPGYGKKIAVLGDMLELGEKETLFHREIGRLLDPRQIDYVFTFGPLAGHIADEARKTFGAERARPFHDKREIVREVLRVAGPNDVVLVKASRGMRLEEVVSGLLAESSGQ
jgi:UDP-N-acetylmuramoyl-tripeptide--D-alanyl-D-alanine ligase